jgi:hypothetical protein
MTTRFMGFCMHEWENIKVIDVYDLERPEGRPMYCKYVLKCKNCGDIKSVRV